MYESSGVLCSVWEPNEKASTPRNSIRFFAMYFDRKATRYKIAVTWFPGSWVPASIPPNGNHCRYKLNYFCQTKCITGLLLQCAKVGQSSTVVAVNERCKLPLCKSASWRCRCRNPIHNNLRSSQSWLMLRQIGNIDLCGSIVTFTLIHGPIDSAQFLSLVFKDRLF